MIIIGIMVRFFLVDDDNGDDGDDDEDDGDDVDDDDDYDGNKS